MVGQRLDLSRILRSEVEAAGHSATVVMVCGPPMMADEVRRLVCDIGSTCDGEIRLIDESFTW